MRHRTTLTVIGIGVIAGSAAVLLAVDWWPGRAPWLVAQNSGGVPAASLETASSQSSEGVPPASTATRTAINVHMVEAAAGETIERASPGALGGSDQALMQRALQAAKDGNLEVLRDLIPRLGSADRLGPQGNTMLHAAAAYGELAAVRLLVGEGASVQTTNDRGEEPLHLAQGEVAAVLIAYGANVAARDARGATPLHRSSYDEAVLLIASGAEIGVRDHAGSTPVLNAIRRGDLPLTKLLISLGANVNDADRRQGVTPLHLAVRRGDSALVTLLIEHGADINAEDKFGNTPLSWTRSPLTRAGGNRERSQVVSLLAQYGAH